MKTISILMKAAIPVLLAGMMAASCNKDDEILSPTGSSDRPAIILDNADGIYTCKVGRELSVAPKFLNVGDTDVTWKENGTVVSTGHVLKITWTAEGTHYITITASNSVGTVYEEIRIDVLELAPPSISLPFETGIVNVKTGSTFKVIAEIGNSDPQNGELTLLWTVDGNVVSSTTELIYEASLSGDHNVKVEATNDDGMDSREFTLRVVDELPESLSFPATSFMYSSTDRYTFPGRGVYLKPTVINLDGSSFEWAIDGIPLKVDSDSYMFVPEESGEYNISLTVDKKAMASVKVICVEASEDTRYRKSSTANAMSNRVYEYVPAPGQFIGEKNVGGMTGDENSHSKACRWAEGRLKNKNYVSLGAWGGYIVVGFDHSIPAGTLAYDFAIQGNAFFNSGTTEGGSHEPGIVYVMQDVNGNGLPDDQWYELRGSETGKATTFQDYSVTYFKPSAPGMNVQWTDNKGNSGTIDYLKAYHDQDYYYPQWIDSEYYTLTGTRIQSQTSQNSSTGLWDNNAFGWGYADNIGTDNLSVGDSLSGEGQLTGFKISNAIYSNGSHIGLKYIDFIKVQTGVQSKAGWLGEVSTEVCSFYDLSIR